MELDKISQIYCINLDKRVDRWEETLFELDKLDLREKTIRFSAIDGYLIENKSRLLNGEYGLNLTHIKLLKEAIKNNYDNVLIFEDDIEFMGNYEFIHSFLNQVPSDWDIIYLGGNHIQSPIKVSHNIGLVVKTYTTHALIINSRVFKFLIDKLEEHSAQLDVIYTSLDLKAYTFIPSLVTQRISFSDIQGGVVDYTPYI